MTNKPMLSVEREVIEKALRDALTIRFDTDSHVTKLRALLDAQHVVCSNGILCQNSKCAECGGNGAYKPAAQHQGEPVACMPVDRCYDVRAKMIIAFNEAKKAGGDLDDALDAAYKSALRYSPNPKTSERPAPVAVDTERLDFILCKSRTVATEILPDGYALYVEEGLMGEKVYPQVKASIVGKENRKSLQRQAIDLAITEVARLNGGKS